MNAVLSKLWMSAVLGTLLALSACTKSPSETSSVATAQPSALGRVSVPTQFKAQALSSTEVRLSWIDQNRIEDTFEIQRSAKAPTNFTRIAGVGPKVTSYVDKNLIPGTTYYYRIRAGTPTVNPERSAWAQTSVTLPKAQPLPFPNPAPAPSPNPAPNPAPSPSPPPASNPGNGSAVVVEPRALASVPAADKVVITSFDQLRREMQSLRPGKHYIISGRINGPGTSQKIVINGNGTAQTPVVIRGASDSTNDSTLSDFSLEVGGKHVVIYRLKMRNVLLKWGGTNLSILRTTFTNYSNPYPETAISMDRGENCVFAYNEMRGDIEPFRGNGFWVYLARTDFPRGLLVYRNLFTGFDAYPGETKGGVPLFLGITFQTSRKRPGFVVRENLFANYRLEGRASIELKTTGSQVINNTFEVWPDDGRHYLRLRHGDDNLVKGNVFVQRAGVRNPGGIQVREFDNQILNNRSIWEDGTQGTAFIHIFAGNIVCGEQNSSGMLQTSCRTRVGGNHMPVTVGANSYGQNQIKATDNIVAPADPSRPDRNLSVVRQYEVNTDFNTPVQGANYNAVANPIARSKVGVNGR